MCICQAKMVCSSQLCDFVTCVNCTVLLISPRAMLKLHVEFVLINICIHLSMYICGYSPKHLYATKYLFVDFESVNEKLSTKSYNFNIFKTQYSNFHNKFFSIMRLVLVQTYAIELKVCEK